MNVRASNGIGSECPLRPLLDTLPKESSLAAPRSRLRCVNKEEVIHLALPGEPQEQRGALGLKPALDRRIEQHNASRVGGAHRTAKRGPGWRCTWYVDGFSSFQQSLQFEYALKRETRSFGYTPAARLRAVRSLIDRWTMQKEATPMLCIQQ